MVLTFDEIGVKMVEYNGLTLGPTIGYIINKAADYLLKDSALRDYEKFYHYEWNVDIVMHTVTIPENAFIH